MHESEFVEMAAGLLTTREMESEGSTPDAEATLDSLIGVARNVAAQTLASANGVTAIQLFDGLGEKIMMLRKGALVIARHRGAEAKIASIEFRESAVVLEVDDQPKGG